MRSLKSLSLGVLALSLTTNAAAAEPPSASHLQAATELVEILGIEKIVTDSYQVFIKRQLQRNPSMTPHRDVLLEWAKRISSSEILRPKLATIYAEAFSEEELLATIAFYKTPAGQKLASLAPAVMERASTLGQQMIEDHYAELEKMILDRAYGLQKLQFESIARPEVIGRAKS